MTGGVGADTGCGAAQDAIVSPTNASMVATFLMVRISDVIIGRMLARNGSRVNSAPGPNSADCAPPPAALTR